MDQQRQNEQEGEQRDQHAPRVEEQPDPPHVACLLR
jgi:hypothetical protein